MLGGIETSHSPFHRSFFHKIRRSNMFINEIEKSSSDQFRFLSNFYFDSFDHYVPIRVHVVFFVVLFVE